MRIFIDLPCDNSAIYARVEVLGLAGWLVRTSHILEHIGSTGVVIGADARSGTVLVSAAAESTFEVAHGAECFLIVDAFCLALVRRRAKVGVGVI
jgi:hypothetical protein